ncbi:MAG: hypothetical protein SF182_07190 [Deltaproteobacteria bacterium]|nr:hypothetical protein [Deltaproteobacteria bacterium]
MPVMKENELSPVGRALVVLGIVGLCGIAAIHIGQGNATHPLWFGASLAGFALFLVAKISVVAHQRWISFGSALMSPAMRDLYRVGYWLMIVGIVGTFL